MPNRTTNDGTIPSGFAEPTREPHAIRLSHPEEGDSRGETWALLRAIILLVAGILAIGYVIS